MNAADTAEAARHLPSGSLHDAEAMCAREQCVDERTFGVTNRRLDTDAADDDRPGFRM
jgi:hypothetical protein